MKLGIMQPYFFPYLGYFALIKHTDKWIVLDTVQFIRHGWIERNRILKPSEGWQYFSIPLEKHSRSTLIKDISIRNIENWKDKILRQLEHYKKIAPYYNETVGFLKDAFSLDTDNLVSMNMHLLVETCRFLEIRIDLSVYSEMGIEIGTVNKPGDWALYISKAVKASDYINPPGGVALFDRESFHQAGIGLHFLQVNLLSYNQGRRNFEPALSIVDTMMFNTPAEINSMLDNYVLI